MKKIEINSIKSLIYGIIDRITGLPDYRITGLPDYRITGLPDYRITGLPDYAFARRRDGHERVRVVAPLPGSVLPA